MVKVQGLSIGQVCKDLGLGESAVRRWLGQFEAVTSLAKSARTFGNPRRDARVQKKTNRRTGWSCVLVELGSIK